MCIFCRLISGEIPVYKVYETKTVLAFLDISPVAPGHTLVIPKEHGRHFENLPAAAAIDLAASLQAVGRLLVDRLGIAGYNIILNNGAAAGQEVPHVHFHLIPRQPGDGLTLFSAGQSSPEELAAILKKLTS